MSRSNKPMPLEVIPPHPPKQRPGPAGGQRDRQRRQRTATLCSSALALFLRQGLDATSIEQIARNAGLGKASFYSYFHHKQELVATIMEPLGQQALQAMDRCHASIESAADFAAFRRAQEQLGAELVASFVAHTDLWRLALQEAHGPTTDARAPILEVHQLLVERAVDHNATALRRGLIRELHPRVIAYINLGAVERLALGFLAGADLGDPAAAAHTLAEVMVAGLQRPAGQ